MFQFLLFLLFLDKFTRSFIGVLFLGKNTYQDSHKSGTQLKNGNTTSTTTYTLTPRTRLKWVGSSSVLEGLDSLTESSSCLDLTVSLFVSIELDKHIQNTFLYDINVTLFL